ncbi:glycosyltransferase family 4 protein [Phyllobacterium sp. 21LDTY02-6]|uniref:glycosyltransferase family 4 protein n=1 Tax=Phyllobacterium sp. 21LDTY02-6 TaxID=2944903 RepID=UPI002020531D|nr:glycosyltransferase family 4 protein [Phyllobacterium sp. 21LDTY02-6]MCO4318235.1 glycosyltransferase family 4 protein [Phyllobacterium sp. 21LDTY02-6]
MRRLYFAYPGDLDTRTGGYGYDRRIVRELGTLGWEVTPVALGDGFPYPEKAVMGDALAQLASLPPRSTVIVDGLAFGTFGHAAAKLAEKLDLIALVHHPLAMEGGLPEDVRDDFERSEWQALAAARSIIVTSATTSRQLETVYDVEPARIVLALPGTDPGPPSKPNPYSPMILSIGSIIPRKGHDVLVDALAKLTDLGWTCRIIGSRSMDPACAQALQRQISELSLASRITLVGAVEDTRREFEFCDIFALASRYEGYGMVFAEAMAHGVPIVACRAGAIAEVVPEDAGFLVAPDDSGGFSLALRRLLEDRAVHASMAAASRRHGANLPSWAESAALISAAAESKA